MASTTSARKTVPASPAPAKRRPVAKPSKERVLIEFPSAALRRADEAARAAGVSRSDFIRAAVESRLNSIEEQELERQLAEAYIANNARNLELLKEFEHVDREAWLRLP
jgi:metal-responsive CopG/Arc/MetJ family transcriptional regulator